MGAGSRTAPSHGELLHLMRRHGPMTRRQLLQRTALSRSTLVERLQTLQALQLVRQVKGDRVSAGRPPSQVEFDDASRRVLAVDLGAVHAVLALTDLSARILATQVIPVQLAGRPDDVLETVLDATTSLLAAQGAGPEGLLGVGVGFPGLTGRSPGAIEAPAVLAHWDGIRAADTFERAFGARALLVNDAHALAYGEYLADGRRRTLLVVKVATGIGAGLVVDGRLHRGDSNGAGQFGHIRVPGQTRRCNCGQRGCLATVASGRALLRRLAPYAITSLDELAEAATSEHAPTVAALSEAGQAVGVVLAGVATMIDPGAILFGGQLGHLPPFLDAVRSAIGTLTYPRTAREVYVGPTVLGDESAVTGLAALIVDTQLDAAGVDALVVSRGG